MYFQLAGFFLLKQETVMSAENISNRTLTRKSWCNESEIITPNKTDVARMGDIDWEGMRQESFEKAIEKAIEEQTVIDEDLIKMVKHFEGFEQTTTYDTDGAMMIGHGFRKEDIPDLKLGDTITKEEAHEVLLRVLGRFGCHVDKTIEVPISKHQRNAMTSFAYNIGPNAFKGSFVAKETNKKNYERAADCFRYWRHVKVDGKKIVSKGLMRRRAAEKLMYLRKAEL